jgi:ribose/xylose/arabinose/galactoside ABC-type transport system permease subunit
MSHARYDDEDDRTTLGLLDPPGPPAYPAPPGTLPPDGQPEGDRAWVHLIWEAFLFFVVLGLFVVVRTTDTAVLSGPGLDNFLTQAAVLGLVATGLAFSVRAAVPNLAVGAIAGMSGVITAEVANETDLTYVAVIGVAVLGAAAIGLVLGIVVVVFHVPAWAVTIGGAVTLAGVLLGTTDSTSTPLTGDVPDVVDRAPALAGAVALVSVLGGAIWLAPRVRHRFGGMRYDGDPARRPRRGAFGALVALVVSSAMAGAGGVLSTVRLGVADPAGGELTTYTALAAVLIGGVSVFGRRAGVFGTILGVLLLSLVQLWLVIEEAESWVFLVVVGVTILTGLVVNRVLEAAGRKPVPPPRYDYY